jgi:hypothetical protein
LPLGANREEAKRNRERNSHDRILPGLWNGGNGAQPLLEYD